MSIDFMKITQLKQGKKDRNRVHLHSEDKYLGTVYIDYVIANHIGENVEISKNDLNKIIKKSNRKKLFYLCIDFVMRRLRSEKEIREYIKKKYFTYKWDYSLKDTDRVVKKLSKYKYIDDEAFARLWASSRLRRGLGPSRLKIELYQKGIEKNLVENIIYELDSELIESQRQQVEEKYLKKHKFKNDYEKVWKVKQYLMSRGFGSS